MFSFILLVFSACAQLKKYICKIFCLLFLYSSQEINNLYLMYIYVLYPKEEDPKNQSSLCTCTSPVNFVLFPPPSLSQYPTCIFNTCSTFRGILCMFWSGLRVFVHWHLKHYFWYLQLRIKKGKWKLDFGNYWKLLWELIISKNSIPGSDKPLKSI